MPQDSPHVAYRAWYNPWRIISGDESKTKYEHRMTFPLTGLKMKVAAHNNKQVSLLIWLPHGPSFTCASGQTTPHYY